MFTIPVTCHCVSCNATETVQAEVTPKYTPTIGLGCFVLIIKDPDQLEPNRWARVHDSKKPEYKCKKCWDPE